MSPHRLLVHPSLRISWQNDARTTGRNRPGVAGRWSMERRGPELLELGERAEPRARHAVPAAADGASEPVLFWAERDLAAAFRGWAVLTALTLPLGLLVPDAVLVAAGIGALVTWLDYKAFRLELTRRELRLRTGLFAATRCWPLAAIGLVEARDAEMRRVRWGGARPAVGHVLIELPDGLLGIPGLREPQELVEAIETLRAGGLGPPAAPRLV